MSIIIGVTTTKKNDKDLMKEIEEHFPTVSALEGEVARSILQETEEKQSAASTLFPPDEYVFKIKGHKSEKVKEVVYKLTLAQKIFLFLEIPDCCVLAKYSSFLMLITIAVSCICFVLSSVDRFRYTPSTCDDPACDDDPTLCPDSQICEPVEDDYFFALETYCIIIFTIDYVLRISTVVTVPPRLSRLLPRYIKHQDPGAPHIPDPDYTWKEKLWKYGTKAFNIIDLVAILPYYISFGVDVGSGFVILRVLRLIRVFRILKSKSVRVGLKIIQKALTQSIPALSILTFLTLLLVLLFGSLIFFFEGGKFTVNDDYPEGAYLRWNVDHSAKEESPFSSILVSIYWAIVTATTVGYGDFYPTTGLGRVTAVFLMYMGIIAIALPISIVGSNFDREYQLVHNAPEEDSEKFSGSRRNMRKEMLKELAELTETMKNISTRVDIIKKHLVDDSKDEDESESSELELLPSEEKHPTVEMKTSKELNITMNKMLDIKSSQE